MVVGKIRRPNFGRGVAAQEEAFPAEAYSFISFQVLGTLSLGVGDE
jgi:hypothetical protein